MMVVVVAVGMLDMPREGDYSAGSNALDAGPAAPCVLLADSYGETTWEGGGPGPGGAPRARARGLGHGADTVVETLHRRALEASGPPPRPAVELNEPFGGGQGGGRAERVEFGGAVGIA